MTLTSQILARLSGEFKKTKGLGEARFTLDAQVPIDLPNGTAAGQADLLYRSIGRVLAASASEDLDLAGVLTDALGDALTFVKVKAIMIFAHATNVNDVVVGNHATAAFVGPLGAAAHTIKVGPGGVLVISAPSAGWTVTPGTADMLKILNGGAGTSVTYDIHIIGTSA